MYINTQVLNCQFEMNIIHLGIFSFCVLSNSDREITCRILYSYIQTSVFHILPKANSRLYRRGGDSIVLPVSIESSCGFGYFSPITSKPWGSLLNCRQEYKQWLFCGGGRRSLGGEQGLYQPTKHLIVHRSTVFIRPSQIRKSTKLQVKGKVSNSCTFENGKYYQITILH